MRDRWRVLLVRIGAEFTQAWARSSTAGATLIEQHWH